MDNENGRRNGTEAEIVTRRIKELNSNPDPQGSFGDFQAELQLNLLLMGTIGNLKLGIPIERILTDLANGPFK